MTARLFQRLGDRVERLWRRRGYRRDAFSRAAARALAEMEPARAIDVAGLLEALPIARWPAPIAGENDYGEPTITVHRGARFRIEVICWRRGATQIHQHDSSGAFAVVAGARLHGTFDFQREERIGRGLSIGRLVATGCELLGPGDIREIAAGPRFIHALCFLDHRCLTLSIRANRGRGGALLYRPPGLAFGAPGPALRKRLASLWYLQEVNPPGFEAAALELIGGAAPRDALHILVELRRDLEQEPWIRVVRKVRRRHGGWIDLLDAAFREETRRAQAVEGVRRLETFEQRLLAGLAWHGQHDAPAAARFAQAAARSGTGR